MIFQDSTIILNKNKIKIHKINNKLKENTKKCQLCQKNQKLNQLKKIMFNKTKIKKLIRTLVDFLLKTVRMKINKIVKFRMILQFKVPVNVLLNHRVQQQNKNKKIKIYLNLQVIQKKQKHKQIIKLMKYLTTNSQIHQQIMK